MGHLRSQLLVLDVAAHDVGGVTVGDLPRARSTPWLKPRGLRSHVGNTHSSNTTALDNLISVLKTKASAVIPSVLPVPIRFPLLALLKIVLFPVEWKGIFRIGDYFIYENK